MAADTSGPDSESSRLCVLTLNCWGIPFISKHVKERFYHIGKELSSGKYDIISLQEVWRKQDYIKLCDKVQTVLPYSHYFYSGVIGSGVCVFSRYPIIEAFTYRFTLNGYFYKVLHGDWFGGKSAGYCLIDHPTKPIHFFTSHLHAEYNRKNDIYLPHRATQAYQMSQFINQTTNPLDCVILCGDMNSEPTDLCYRVLTSLPKLEDAWLMHKPEGYHGNTCDVSHNRYTSFALPKELLKGNSDGKRIDYVFYHGDPKVFTCVDCEVTMQQIPGTDMSYSDHEGVMATFMFGQNDSFTEEKEFKSNHASTKAVLEEVSSLMKRKLNATPYHKQALYIALGLLLFVLLPLFIPQGNILSNDVGTNFGIVLYVVRVLCCMSVTVLLFYVLLGDTDEYNAYKDVFESVNLKLLYMKSK